MYAHIDQDTNKKQFLLDHLINTAKKASADATDINQRNFCFLIGLFHDLGKADKNFQHMIKNNTKDKVNHSSAGATYLLSKIMEVIPNSEKSKQEFSETVMYVICAHHGIFDIQLKEPNVKMDNKLVYRIYYNKIGSKKYYYNEDILPFTEEIESSIKNKYGVTLNILVERAYDEFVELSSKLSPNDQTEEYFYRGLKVRLYLSILKNADIFDTINAYDVKVEQRSVQNKKELINKYEKNIEDVYEQYRNPASEINKIRNRIANESLKRGETDSPGIYQLNLPTGSGKTKVSIRYAIHQMNKQNRKRFLYITPFLSVLEQNANEIKNILSEKGVFEHHSNVVKENNIENIENKRETYKQYLMDSWDELVILSTMVQFTQTLFKGKSANIRRFSSLMNTVIVLDEIQSLPTEVTTMFNLTMNFLSKVMNSTIILCTATQPKYDATALDHKIEYGGQNKEEKNIVQLNNQELEIFRRNTVLKFNEGRESSIFEVADEVLYYNEKSVLIILNTKKAATDLYNELKNLTSRKCYLLSTNLCPAHRKNVIRKIREEIEFEPIICVSTQIIEAGVDLDFDILFRSYAGIDSIVQAMGRCNREGKNNKEDAIVQLINFEEGIENLRSLKSIKNKKEITEQILHKIDAPINITKLNNRYFEKYYANTQKQLFNYPLGTDKSSVYDLLSVNTDFRTRTNYKLRQNFKEAADEFNLIQNETTDIIVYYKKSEELIERLYELIDLIETTYNFDLINDVKEILKQLQPYTISVYDVNKLSDYLMTFDKIENSLLGEIRILTEDYYDEEMGLKEIESLII